MKIMDETITIRQDGNPIYDIHIGHGFDGLRRVMEDPAVRGSKACIVTDSRVRAHYLDEVKKKIEPCVALATSFVFEEGEASKNLDTVKDLYRHLIESHFERGDVLIALGGGVVGDMTGFAAATFLRGMRFIQVPTSLLAMVDSGVGGKTGVDVDGYKNMVGAFHQPYAVCVNLSTLHTLPSEHLIAGFGEVVKHALIADADYLSHLEDVSGKVGRKGLFEFWHEGLMGDVVAWSVRIKQRIVEKDPFEKNERMLLNFGHTLGHALEKYMDFTLLHGQCVSLGMVAALHLSERKGGLTQEESKRIVRVLDAFGLPVRLFEVQAEKVVELVKNDKKMKDGRIQFVLLKGIGKPYVDCEVTEQEMKDALKDICICV